MGEEMETYMLEKLNAAIIEASSGDFHLATKLFLPTLKKEFTDLRDLILEKSKLIKESAATKQSAAAAAVPAASAAPAAASASPAPPPAAAAVPPASASTAPPTAASAPPPSAASASPAPPPAATGVAPTESTITASNRDPTAVSSISAAANVPKTSAASTGGSAADGSKTPAAVTSGDAAKDKSKTPTTPASASAAPDGGVIPAKESDAPPATAPAKPDELKTTETKPESQPINEENLLREQLYYLNNVLTEWQTITKRPFSFSTDSVASIKDLRQSLKKIKQDLKPDSTSTKKTKDSVNADESANISTTASIRSTSEDAEEYRWSISLNSKQVYGFGDKILSLERLLVLRRKDTDQFKAFGIHGMAGVGKTTLCQSIFSRPKVKEYFFPRIWVCLSKQKGEDKEDHKKEDEEYHKKEVVKRMLSCLGTDNNIIKKVDEKMKGIRGLLFALRLQLTGKRYLIVLDDAYILDEWFKMEDSSDQDVCKSYERFAYGLPKDCGGTVLVTSRVEGVVKNMVGDEDNLRCMEPLTDTDSCWNIFIDTVGEDGTKLADDEKQEILKAEIVKRCDGLPLAAKLMGQIKRKELRDRS